MGYLKAWAVGAMVLGVGSWARGAVLFESSQHTAVHQTGGTVLSPAPPVEFLGVRFALGQGAEVTSVGGEIAQLDSGSLFAALVRLDGPTALPHGSPFADDELLAVATFTGTKPSSAVDVPMHLSLGPGEYGLIFGSGMFGADAHGTMIYETGLAGVSFFDWYDPFAQGQPIWQPGGFVPAYFVVNGTVPEPGAVQFFGAVGVLCVRRRAERARMRLIGLMGLMSPIFESHSAAAGQEGDCGDR
jgi:hypothetical protein